MTRILLRVGDVELEINWTGTGSEATAAVSADIGEPTQTSIGASGVRSNTHRVRSPGVGVFYHAPRPTANSFVAQGDFIEDGQQIGILEVMKLMIPVESDITGRVVEYIVEDGSSVEYGEDLLEISLE